VKDDSVRFSVEDPYKLAGRTDVNNALLYADFPVSIRKKDTNGNLTGEIVRKPRLSKPARVTYLGLLSLDWTQKQEVWYTWGKMCLLLDLSRRTFALHLEELEGAGLILRYSRHAEDPHKGTHYRFTAIPLREVWRAILLKKRVTGVGPEPHLKPGVEMPTDRKDFDRFFTAYWNAWGPRHEREWETILREQMKFPPIGEED
jgi:DNA-binding transcriptional ArsR family regulator